MSSKSKRKVFISTLVVIILIAISIGIILSLNSPQEQVQKNTEDKELLEANKDIIETAQAFKSQNLREINGSDKVWGNKDAKVKIIVYEDYTNNFSAKLNESLKKLQEEFSKNEIQIAFRPFFYKTQKSSLYLAQLMECAYEQDSFLPLRDKFFSYLNQGQEYVLVNPLEVAKEINGINQKQLETCLTQEKYKDKVLNTSQEARNYGVTGTPTIFIEDQMIVGARSFETKIQDKEKITGLKDLVKDN